MNKKIFPLAIMGIVFLAALAGFLSSGTSRTTAPQQILYYIANGDIYELASNTTGERKITSFGDVYQIFDQKNNGKNSTVLFARKSGVNPEADTDTTFGASLWIIDSKTKFTAKPIVADQIVMNAQLFPNGTEILYRLYTADLFRISVTGETPTKIADKVLSPSLISDGKRVVYQKLNPEWRPGFYADSALGLHVLDLTTGKEDKLTNSWEDFDPRWSDDGTQILFSSSRQPNPTTPVHLASIWIMDADGQNQKQITNVGQTEYGPETLTAPSYPPLWSSDKRQIIYEADRAIHSIVYNPTERKMIQYKIITYGTNPQWLENGKNIAVMNIPNSTQTPKVMKFDLNGNIIP